MASMTDVVFLLLIFFMVTSTYVFPTALEVNLPKSAEQTVLKPSVRIYLNADGQLSAIAGDSEPEPIEVSRLGFWLKMVADQSAEETPAIALYADEQVPYGKIVEVLNAGAQVNLKIVLATKPMTPEADSPAPAPAPADADVQAPLNQ